MADDVVLVFHGVIATEIERQANAGLTMLRGSQTMVVMTTFTMTKEMKILGQIIDRLTFNAHVTSTPFNVTHAIRLLAEGHITTPKTTMAALLSKLRPTTIAVKIRQSMLL